MKLLVNFLRERERKKKKKKSEGVRGKWFSEKGEQG